MKSYAKTLSSRRPTLAILTSAICLLAAVAARADYSSTVLSDHPVAYFPMTDADGSSTVVDATTNGFVGNLTYATQSNGISVFPVLGEPGVDSNSVLFATGNNGQQGHIDIPLFNGSSTTNINSALSDGTNGAPFSAEIWVNATTDSTANFEVPLDDSSDFNQPAPFNASAGWNLYQTQGPGSTWSYSIRPYGFVGNGAPVVIGQWTHLVLTYDGTHSTLYANGAQVRTDTPTSYLINNGSSDMQVGWGPATGFAPWDGFSGQLAIYNYALSPAQIANHYSVGTNEILAPATPPNLTTVPADTTTFSGVPVTFTSQALGTAPLSYQWVRGGKAPIGPITDATNKNYSFTPTYPNDDQATFSVTVTNAAGSTNSPAATLTVSTALNVNNSPFSITRRVGSHAAFRVAANGAVPITYQWHVVSNDVDTALSGQTADTLWLNSVQTSQSGNQYYAAVTGPFTSGTSDAATLTVIPRTSFAPTNAYSSVVMADDPVAFLRFDEATGATNALDGAGSFDGAYADDADIIFGYPSGIPLDTDTAIHVTNSATVTIPYALELNPVTGPWSYEFWLKPTSQTGNFVTPISAEGNQNAGANLSGWNIYQHNQGYWTWNIFNGGGNGSFTSEFADHPVFTGGWYHMVLTDDTTNMNWWSNGRLVFTTTTAAVSFLPNGINGDPGVAGGPTTIGVRSDGVFGDWDGGFEDLAVYNYVLSPAQILNHFHNTTTLTIAPSGNQLVVSWSAGTLLWSTTANGTYTPVPAASAPSYTFAPSGSQLFFKVQLQ